MTLRSLRFIVTLALGALLAPLAADAQQPGGVARIGILWPGTSPPRPPRMEAFRQGLRESGYVDGQNIAIELRYAEGGPIRLPDLAAELVQRNVNVIAVFGDQAVHAAQQATRTIPIVALTDDIVGAGLVASLARPGGNTTGVSMLAPELGAKRLDLLKQILPGISRVAVLWDSGTPRSQLQATENAARSLAVRLQVLEVRDPRDIDHAFQAAKKERAEAFNVLASPMLSAHTNTIVALAAKTRLPVIYQWRESVEVGGLISYGTTLSEMWRQTALMVAKLLKGAKLADLPVEQPTKFELVINLKTAKTLGLTIPQSVLIRADEVIQ